MSIKATLSMTIKAARLNCGLSQDKLSAKADISTRHYQEIETGRAQPSVDTIFKIARALDLSYNDIVTPAWNEWVNR